MDLLMLAFFLSCILINNISAESDEQTGPNQEGEDKNWRLLLHRLRPVLSGVSSIYCQYCPTATQGFLAVSHST